MALMMKQDYLESLRRVEKRVFVLGQEIADYAGHPLVRPSLNACAETYALAEEPARAASALARAGLAGSNVIAARVNRFTHLHQGPADLVAKEELLRLLGQKTGCCFQRRVGMDA